MTFGPPDGVLDLDSDCEYDAASDQSDQQNGRDGSVESGGQADEEEEGGQDQAGVADSLEAGGGSSPTGPTLGNRVAGVC